MQKLDEFANVTIIQALDHTGLLAAMASEEMEDFYPIPDPHVRGPYILVFDPVDGSSNIDVNVSIGTIFSVYRPGGGADVPSAESFLRPGREQLCAGYFVYGSSTMLVYTTGRGRPRLHPGPDDRRVPALPREHPHPGAGRHLQRQRGQRRRLERRRARLRGQPQGEGLLGALHRIPGLRLPPQPAQGRGVPLSGDRKSPEGKLRLLYEANPLAFIVEQAGGAASSGRGPILDLVPQALHQRVPLAIGSRLDVEEFEAAVGGEGPAGS